MAFQAGQYLGGVRDLEGIRMRCVCDSEEDGCWHFRTANGKPVSRGRQTVWMYGLGKAISVPKAVWELKAGKRMPRGWCAFRICESYDCANPAHIKAGPRSAYGVACAARGVFKANGENARKVGLSRSKLTDEQRRMLILSELSGPKMAAILGVSASTVARIRSQHRKRAQLGAISVFHLGQA